MAIYRTAVHGIAIDMEKLKIQNQKEIALGNMGTNARGDVLGKGGKVLETREEVIEKFYEANPELNPKAVVNLKTSLTDKEKMKEVEAEVKQEPKPASSQPRRKKPAVVETFNIDEEPKVEE